MTKVKLKWTDVDKNEFISTKKIIGYEVLPSYPKFSEIFIINTGTSKTQLGGVIIQNGKTINFYSRKVIPEQINYSTTEQ